MSGETGHGAGWNGSDEGPSGQWAVWDGNESPSSAHRSSGLELLEHRRRARAPAIDLGVTERRGSWRSRGDASGGIDPRAAESPPVRSEREEGQRLSREEAPGRRRRSKPISGVSRALLGRGGTRGGERRLLGTVGLGTCLPSPSIRWSQPFASVLQSSRAQRAPRSPRCWPRTVLRKPTAVPVCRRYARRRQRPQARPQSTASIPCSSRPWVHPS